MSDNKEALPRLPEPHVTSFVTDSVMRPHELKTYSAKQMREYATAALSELRAEVERLKAELKRLQPHAARYKWLRDRHSGEFEKIILMSEWCSRSDWDNAIDAARSAASGESAGGV